MLILINRFSTAPEAFTSVNMLKKLFSECLRACNLTLSNKSLYIVLISYKQMHTLNLKFKKDNCATNVLSFPSYNTTTLGEIVICPSVVVTQAIENNISLRNHYLHIVTHGILHLLGYSHNCMEKTDIMLQKEQEILQEMGIPHPYSQ
jgi:probable rRNA maturation factor